MRVIVDWDRCESNGRCMDAAPEVFQVQDDDVLHVLQEHPDPSLREQVLQAVEACPKLALSVEEE